VILDAGNHHPIASQTDLALRLDSTVHVPANSILIHRDGREIPIADTVSPIHDLLGRGLRLGGHVAVVAVLERTRAHAEVLDDELVHALAALVWFAAQRRAAARASPAFRSPSWTPTLPVLSARWR